MVRMVENGFSRHCVIWNKKFGTEQYPGRLSVEVYPGEYYDDMAPEGPEIDMCELLDEWYRYVYLKGESAAIEAGSLEEMVGDAV